MGIHTGADLRDADPALLEARFGKAGRWFVRIANAQDDRPVQPNRVRTSTGSETTVSRDMVLPDEIEAKVAEMADDVWDWAERTATSGRTVTVKVKFSDFRQVTRSRSVAAPVPDRAALHRIARDLVRTVYPPRAGIRLVGVTLSALAPASEPEEPLLPI
jgi:DNA polymerase-4